MNLDTVVKKIASGELQIRDDEYIGENGLPYCKNCKTTRMWYSPDKQFVARCYCKCEEEAEERRKKEEARQKPIAEFNSLSSLSMLGDRYRGIRIKDAIITESNRAVYEKCHNYVTNAKAMRENNIGLYIYGDNSSGKTYLTACICNELLWQGFRCVYTNLATILNEILEWVDGFITTDKIAITDGNFNDKGDGYEAVADLPETVYGGVITEVHGNNKLGFTPKATEENMDAGEGFYCNYGSTWRSNTVYLPYFGGFRANGAYAGAFSFDCDSSASVAISTVGARLCFCGKE